MCPEIKRVACVGSGLVGQGWAALFALNGYEVVLEDLNDRLLKDALTRIKNQMVFLIDAGLAKEKDDLLESIETTTDVKSAVKNADYVQESIFESYDAKKALYSKMDEFTSSDVILASSTSGLMMTEIQKAAKLHPERCIVAHPYNPSYLVPLVELSPGKLTSETTIKRAYELMERIGKVPVTLKKEVPGFIANRLSAALWREALSLVDDGVASVEDVDKAIWAGPGMRWAIMGPYLTYHLGGGKGGIEYLMHHIGVTKSEWLSTMAQWTVTPDSAVEKAIIGVKELDIVKKKSFEELEAWRDEQLVKIIKIQGKEK